MTRPITQADLPTTRALLRSTLIAAVVATALLVTVVLPAEYGIDPTRIGRVLGLTEMGETKSTLEKEANADVARSSPVAPALPCPPAPAVVVAEPTSSVDAGSVASSTDHTTRVTLKPGEAKEVKLTMRANAKVSFSWSTDRGVVNYDLHSDNPATGKYHGYGKGQGLNKHEGVLVAAFDGSHGWFWRNRTNADITITLTTTGDYQEVKELK